MTLIHDRLASAMFLFALLAGAWGLVAYFRDRGVDGRFWGILAAGELLFLVQAVVGITLWLQGLRPTRTIHLLYGAVMVLTWPGYYAISRGRDDKAAAFVYGLLGVFLAGIVLRANGTGR